MTLLGRVAVTIGFGLWPIVFISIASFGMMGCDAACMAGPAIRGQLTTPTAIAALGVALIEIANVGRRSTVLRTGAAGLVLGVIAFLALPTTAGSLRLFLLASAAFAAAELVARARPPLLVAALGLLTGSGHHRLDGPLDSVLHLVGRPEPAFGNPAAVERARVGPTSRGCCLTLWTRPPATLTIARRGSGPANTATRAQRGRTMSTDRRRTVEGYSPHRGSLPGFERVAEYVRPAAVPRGPWHALASEHRAFVHAHCGWLMDVGRVERRATFPGEMSMCTRCVDELASSGLVGPSA